MDESQAGINIAGRNINNLRYAYDISLMEKSEEEIKSLFPSGEPGVSGDFWGGSKITADGDCSHKIKRYLLLGRKAVTNLDSILKSRDITLPTKVHLVKAMFFQ